MGRKCLECGANATEVKGNWCTECGAELPVVPKVEETKEEEKIEEVPKESVQSKAETMRIEKREDDDVRSSIDVSRGTKRKLESMKMKDKYGNLKESYEKVVLRLIWNKEMSVKPPTESAS